MKYRAELDGLRAFAVLSVVIYHAFPKLIPGGFVGVDVFFVISGYLITRIIMDGLRSDSFSFLGFYSRRVRRIFPALFAVLLASYLFGWFVLLPDKFMQFGLHMASGAAFVSNIVLWSEAGYFDTAAITKPLLHLWSLGVEEQFYIIWPILLVIGYRLRFNLLALALIIAGLSFAANILTVDTDPNAAFFLPHTRFWELLSGSVLAWFAVFRAGSQSASGSGETLLLGGLPYRRAITNLLSAMGIGLLLFAVTRIDDDHVFPGYWAALPVLGAFLVIAAGPNALTSRTLLANPVSIWFGLISYPLYLWHWPVLSFARIMESATPSWKIRAAAVVASIILAWLTYRFLERPLRYGKNARKKVAGLVVAMTLIGVTGWATYNFEGLSFRYPEVVRELTSFKFDYRLAYREGTCFLRPHQTYDDFSMCESASKPDQPKLMIWGDSHAAHLYPGYLKYFGGRYDILQRTASGCPPIIDLEIHNRTNCKAINDFVFQQIIKDPPDILILAANWIYSPYDLLDGTLIKLKAAGIENIEVVGPVPRWKDGLPKQMTAYFKARDMSSLPERMAFGLNRSFAALDPKLRKLVDKHGIQYNSPSQILCSENGCLTRLDETSTSITAWDVSHLTTMGSEYLVSKFPGAQK